MKKGNELILRGTDRQTARQTNRIQSWRSKKTFGQVILILHLSCKEEVKDIYTVFSFSVLINARNKFLGLSITLAKCNFF